VALESGNSIKATESKILFDKKTMIEGNTTIDKDIHDVQAKASHVESPVSAEEPASTEASTSEDENLSAGEAILVT